MYTVDHYCSGERPDFAPPLTSQGNAFAAAVDRARYAGRYGTDAPLSRLDKSNRKLAFEDDKAGVAVVRRRGTTACRDAMSSAATSPWMALPGTKDVFGYPPLFGAVFPRLMDKKRGAKS